MISGTIFWWFLYSREKIRAKNSKTKKNQKNPWGTISVSLFKIHRETSWSVSRVNFRRWIGLWHLETPIPPTSSRKSTILKRRSINREQIWVDPNIVENVENSEKNMKNQKFQTFKTFPKLLEFHSHMTFMHPRGYKRCEKHIPGTTSTPFLPNIHRKFI